MTCECLALATKEIKEMYRDKAGDDVQARCENLALVLGDDAKTGPGIYLPFRVSSSKKPFNTKKGHTIHVFISYCPICGIKYQEDEDKP